MSQETVGTMTLIEHLRELRTRVIYAVIGFVIAAGLGWTFHAQVFEWLMENVRPYALWLGAALGGFVGFLGSVGVVVFDARRGRLKRVP